MSENIVKWDAMMEVATLTDIGMRRTNNQDNFCVWYAPSMEQWEDRGHLFVVADGMGAHAAGELASKIAVDNIPHLFNKYRSISASEALRRALEDANSEIHRRGQANEEFLNMGTTCSTLLLTREGAFAGHVGDSRVYRLRGHQFEQLTFDHSLVWEMRQHGSSAEFETPGGSRIPKNVITRSLGPYAEVQVDLEGPYDVQPGDQFMLCSDGLTGQIEDQEIGALMNALSPTDAARVMVDLANLRGGPDNITLIIVRIVGSQLAAETSGKSRSATKTDNGAAPAPRPAKFVGVLLWSLMAVLLLAGWLLFWTTGNPIIAMIPLLLAVGVLAIILVRWMQGSSPGVEDPVTSPGGGGPYVKIDCRPAAWKTVDQLRDMVLQIRDAGAQKGWQIPEAALQQRLAKAEAIAATRDARATLKEFALIITFLMDKLRRNGRSS